MISYLFALLFGAIMTCAFAPYSIGMAAVISCAGLLAILKDQSPLTAFKKGWCYGVGMFGTGVYWIYTSIHDFGYASPFLASFITGLLVIFMALYPAFLAAVLCRFFPRENAIRYLMAFPVLWVLFEMLRGWFLTGFPWLYVGNAQMGNSLRYFAPIGGVWLVSWVTVLFASLLYFVWKHYYRREIWLGIACLWLIAVGLGRIEWTVPTGKTLSVALVQGNIAQLMRWDPQHIRHIIDTYENLTLNISGSELIIWPEAAIPLPLPLANPIFQRMDRSLESKNVGLIAGVPFEIPDGMHFYNSLIGVGSAQGLYHKIHLLPFGDYVPFERWLRGLIGFFDLPMSSFISGSSKQSPIYVQEYRIAPAICYEIAFPSHVQQTSQNTDFILTVSNDAWFGKSIGPAQHLEIAQFRALENGKALLRATNTGWTAIIAPTGEILAMSPSFTEDVLRGTVPQMSGQTPWNRWGLIPILTALLLTLFIAIGLQRRAN